MAVGVERRARKAASRLNQALLLEPASNAMTYNPLTHTTGVGLSVSQNPTLYRAENPIDSDGTIPGLGIELSLQELSTKKRRQSKGKIPAEIRRSTSTSHMRNLALSTSGELSPTSDKRRNKLGYHRTSVACGHCRRRKIRCLVAPDDAQGRCANCIRLKKECNFYPVEQNPEQQPPPAGTVKEPGARAPASSTTSSPRHPPSATGEKIEEFRPPFPVSHPAASRYGMQAEVDLDPRQAPHTGGIPMPHPQYAYPPPIETQWTTPGFLPSSSIADNSPSSSGYWRPSPSTATSAYGSETNISGAPTPATISSTSNVSYGAPPENHNWGSPNVATPTRSMSYGNIEGLPHQYSTPGLGIQQHDYPRRTSPYPYPGAIDTSGSVMHNTTLGGTTAAPLSAPVLPNHQYNYPQAWNSYGSVQPPAPEAPIPSRSMSMQWYHEPGQLDQVQEEGSHAAPYTHHGVPQFYSGP